MFRRVTKMIEGIFLLPKKVFKKLSFIEKLCVIISKDYKKRRFFVAVRKMPIIFGKTKKIRF